MAGPSGLTGFGAGGFVGDFEGAADAGRARAGKRQARRRREHDVIGATNTPFMIRPLRWEGGLQDERGTSAASDFPQLPIAEVVAFFSQPNPVAGKERTTMHPSKLQSAGKTLQQLR